AAGSKSGVRCSSNRILTIISVVRVNRIDDLGEIVLRLRLSCLILNRAKSGEEQTDQDRNDRNHNEQFDEGKGGGVFLHCGGIMSRQIALHNDFVEVWWGLCQPQNRGFLFY